MEMGPVEYIVIDFPGNQFNGDVIPALMDLVDSGTVRIIDLLFVYKDADGKLEAYEAGEAAELQAMFADVDYEVLSLFSDEDIELLGEGLPADSSAAFMVWENLWSARFAQAVRDSGGLVVENARIPRDVLEIALAYEEEVEN